MQGTYLLLIVLTFCFAAWPEATINALTALSLKIQIYWINWRLKCQARKIHRELTRLCKEAGWPAPGPFIYVDLWDRD